MRQSTKQALDYILDCFSGADGGVSYAYFQAMLNNLDQQAEAGDEKAQKVILILHQFAKMIEVAQPT